MADFINTIDVLGDDAVIDSIIDRSITELKDDQIETVGQYAFHGCAALSVVNLPAVTYVSAYAFHGCAALSDINLPAATSVNGNAFSYCNSPFDLSLPAVTYVSTAFWRCEGVKKLRLPKCELIDGTQAFHSTVRLIAIILENTEIVCALKNGNAFNTTSAIGKGTGYIYVPRALVDRYKAATNWSVYASQFRALEDYTVDGTVTGELDETKI